MELKTLKDLNFANLEPQRTQLRQEAIKEIKVLKNLGESKEDLLWENITGKKIVYSKSAVETVIKYIKWKFNITNEDLK